MRHVARWPNGNCPIPIVPATVFMLVLSLWAPAGALTYDTEKLVCPIDGKSFETETVGSYSQFGIRLDLRPLGALVAPLPMPVCPDNGFVLYKPKFSKVEISRLRQIVAGDDFKQARKVHTDYYMAAFLQKRLGGKMQELAWTYLRASWEVPDEQKRKQQAYMKLALEGFVALLDSRKEQDREWWNAQLVAANLERKLGLFDAARKRIARLDVANSKQGENYQKLITQTLQWIEKHNTEHQKFVAD